MRFDANITIVIATHNRPDCLRLAVESALRQTHTRWRMLVLGDGCDARTPNALQDIADPRVSYIDLPVRFGEQSGPNSVGMSLATTDWIAFLNHDDLWLPDHLEYALEKLARSGADLFLGQAAFTDSSGTTQRIVSEHRNDNLACATSGHVQLWRTQAARGAARLFNSSHNCAET